MQKKQNLLETFIHEYGYSQMNKYIKNFHAYARFIIADIELFQTTSIKTNFTWNYIFLIQNSNFHFFLNFKFFFDHF